jgi:hypothetical protein
LGIGYEWGCVPFPTLATASHPKSLQRSLALSAVHAGRVYADGEAGVVERPVL